MRKRTIVASVFAALIGVGSIAIALNSHVRLASASHLFSEAAVPSRRVAIVLGAGLQRPGVPGAVLADRLELALRLHRAGRIEKILVSGDNDGRGHDEVNPMRSWLVERGVPSSDIFMDHAGFRTHDTMQRAAKVFEVDSAIVCTQQFHLARSVYLARSAGIDAVGVPALNKRWRAHELAHAREIAARVKAVADVTLGVSPRHLGKPIPIASAPASATHDS